MIHNAGTIHPSYHTDPAGTELTYAGQVVAPFLLTAMLMPRLAAVDATARDLLWDRCARAAVITPPVPFGFENDTGVWVS